MTGAFLLFLTLALLILITVYAGKLTIPGALMGGLIAIALYFGTGFSSLLLLGGFFLLGTMATSWKFKQKAEHGFAEKNHGRRDIFQVIANGGVAGLLACIALIFPQYNELILLMIASSFSAATADTLSSELGTLYGSRFFNVITFSPDKRGENGVVSVEGLLIGLAGSCVIATIYAGFNFFEWHYVLIIVIAGTAGNVIDSILGATLERNGKIQNNAVNFINTLSSALIGWMLFLI